MARIPGLSIDPASDAPVYRQIADGIRAALDEGRVRPGDRLPPTRALARQLGVNRNTVVAAYDLLAGEGVIRSRTGQGTFLTGGAEPLDPGAVEAGAAAAEEGWSGSFSRAVDGPGVERLMSVYRVAISNRGISFAGSYPAGELLPIDDFRGAIDDVLAERGPEVLAYGPTAGDPGLREALVATMRRNGSTLAADNVVITNGAQQALSLVFRTLLDPGDEVLVEDPTYTGALSVLGSLGARVVGVPADDEGPRPDALAAALERHRPRLMYLQPTFHNPTTRVMPEARRREVLALAARHHCAVVEDDWAADLRFEGEAPPTLHALDGGRHVLYLSTFSKKLMPGLRIGWIAAPFEVARRVVALKQIADCGTSPLLQAALVRFMERGSLDRHLDRIRAAYRERRDAMLRSLGRHLPEGVRFTRPAGGLFLWVTLPGGLDSGELFVAARQRGVLFSRGALFHIDGRGVDTMRMTYASAAPDRIDEGVRVLGELVRERLADAGRGGGERVMESVPVL